MFFIDIEGHIEDTIIAKSLQALEKQSSLIKHLGSYPQNLE